MSLLSPGRERLLLITLSAAMFAHIMDFMIIMPLGPELMKLFKITPGQFSLLVSSYTISAGVTGFLAAFVIDRFDRKTAMLFLFGGFGLGTLACAFAPDFNILLITRSAAGAFGGVLGALILSIVSDAVPLERRAKGIGFVMASFGIASVVGVPFGLYIANKSNWQAPFLLLGGFSLLVLIAAYFSLPQLKSHQSGPARKPLEIISALLGNANTRMGLLFSSLLMLGHFTIIPFVATYMVGNVGLRNDQLFYIYLVGGISTMLFSPFVGWLADKYGRLKIFTIFGSLVIIPILAITHLPVVPIWFSLIIAAIFFIFSNGRMVPSTTMETAVVKPELRGSYLSLRSSVQQLTSGLAAFIAGYIISEKPSEFNQDYNALVNYEYVGYIAVFFSLMALLVARRLKVST